MAGKRAKKPLKSRLLRLADDAWAGLIKSAAWGCCEWCGSAKRLQAHHMIGKTHNRFLRHRVENGVSLCGRCHLLFHRNSVRRFKGWRAFRRGRFADSVFVELNIDRKAPDTSNHYRHVLRYLDETQKAQEIQN